MSCASGGLATYCCPCGPHRRATVAGLGLVGGTVRSSQDAKVLLSHRCLTSKQIPSRPAARRFYARRLPPRSPPASYSGSVMTATRCALARWGADNEHRVQCSHQALPSRDICCSRSRYFITSSTVSVSEISWRVNPTSNNACRGFPGVSLASQIRLIVRSGSLGIPDIFESCM